MSEERRTRLGQLVVVVHLLRRKHSMSGQYVKHRNGTTPGDCPLVPRSKKQMTSGRHFDHDGCVELMDDQVQQSPWHWTRSLFTFVWVFGAVVLSIEAWSLSTPLGAGAPDEPAQVIQSAALVRGQFDGPQVPFKAGKLPIGRIGTVEVPQWVTIFPLPNIYLDVPYCFDYGPQRSVSCVTYTPRRVSPSTANIPIRFSRKLNF